MTNPPGFLQLDEAGRACWHRVHSRLVAQGIWEPEFAMPLDWLCSQCSMYLRFAREVQRLKADNMCTEELDAELADTHRIAREYLVEFQVIPASRVAIVPLDDDGIDLEISRLCEPLEPALTM